MRCISYCTAEEYKMSDVVQSLIKKGLNPQHFDDIIYVQRKIYKQKIDTFYFSFGCVVIWGSEGDNEDKIILEEIESHAIKPVDDEVKDIIQYRYDKKSSKSFADEENNEIILNDELTFTKLSASYALAQSIKLTVLENSVVVLLQKSNPLRKELAEKGTISLSKKQISKQIGVLFNERYSINMHSDILDTPEFFWKRPSYEPFYLSTVEFQDVEIRQKALNHRLDIIHELYSILSNELNYIHSARLETVIVILIGIEVIMGILDSSILMKIIHWFI